MQWCQTRVRNNIVLFLDVVMRKLAEGPVYDVPFHGTRVCVAAEQEPPGPAKQDHDGANQTPEHE